MKNILLIGDSIRIGYDKSVRTPLQGLANVYFPEENTRFASYVLRYLHEYKGLVPGGHVDVLHWNAGLWDCLRLFGEDVHTPVEIYAYYIDRICARIQKIFPDAKVIFA
ncbi:MAG: SGNH/GDSL hydrolase family protein, partial [Clostridia bacterium]|nr:SGNH/GDSL hydrolase family protein [Clostridia bacterium]